jgi:hypothetical protein
MHIPFDFALPYVVKWRAAAALIASERNAKLKKEQ